MNPSQRLTCLQCLEHPYLADLARKDARWQAQLRQLQASVAAAAGAATGSIRCDSSASTNTHMEDSACSGPDSRQGSLPSALSPGSLQQQQQRQGVLKQGAVPRLQLQQPGIKAFPASNLGGTSSTSQSKQGTPRTSVGHAAGGAASKQRQQQQQQVQLQSLGSSKQLAAPKVQPVIKKQPSKGHAAQPTAASQSLPGRSNAGSRGMPSLHLGPTKPGQLQVEVTPRSKPHAASPAAASPAAGYGPPVTRSKAAAMAAVSQAYGQPASGAAAAADAAAAAGGDVDMGDADGPVSSRRRKRLASGTPLGGTSLRGGGRRELEADDTNQQGPRSPAISLPPAAGSGAAGARRQQGSSSMQPQQQWGGSAGHTGGYAPSKMDVDINLGVASGNSSRPQSPLTRTSATGATGPYSLNTPVWRDGARDAGGLAGNQQQGLLQQGLKPAPGGSSRWGAGLGLTGGMASPQAASPGGRGAGKAPAWGTVEPSGGTSHMGHSSFGVAASALGTWSDDAAAAAGATMGVQAGIGPGSSISTRSSLAAALPVFADALSGLQAGGGGHAPVSSSLASGGLYGRGSMVGPQAANMAGAAGPGGAATGVGRYPPAPGLQLEEARVSLAGAGGGHQQQQHSPPHQPYLHQHLYTHH